MALLNISKYNVGGISPFGAAMQGMGAGLDERLKLAEQYKAEMLQMREDMEDDREKLLKIVMDAKTPAEIDFAKHINNYFKRRYKNWDVSSDSIDRIWSDSPANYEYKQRPITEYRKHKEYLSDQEKRRLDIQATEAGIGLKKAQTENALAQAARARRDETPTPQETIIKRQEAAYKELKDMKLSPANTIEAKAFILRLLREYPDANPVTIVNYAKSQKPEIFKSVIKEEEDTLGFVLEEAGFGAEPEVFTTEQDQKGSSPEAEMPYINLKYYKGRVYEKAPDGNVYDVTDQISPQKMRYLEIQSSLGDMRSAAPESTAPIVGPGATIPGYKKILEAQKASGR